MPENPNEITTEGGLDVAGNFEAVEKAVSALKDAGIFVSIFLDPDTAQINAAADAGAQQVELCTAEYAELTLSSRAAHGAGKEKAEAEVERIRSAATHASSHGMVVAAGHGLTYRNVGALSAIADISEFNIGHNIISRSVFVGLGPAVREMIDAIRAADAVPPLRLSLVSCSSKFSTPSAEPGVRPGSPALPVPSVLPLPRDWDWLPYAVIFSA